MRRFAQKIRRLLADTDGATAIEYAMLVGLIFLVVLTAITAVGQATTDSFEYSRDSINRSVDDA